ncbi:Ribosome-binding ATPase YchF [Candidatus Zixiibacteriota bacterium]|nr:Ribosome-binding ATPase YchF [candidate division Zixibacteria bacterium]
MKLGIIGLPQSGKTTLFNAASGQTEAVGDYSRATHRAIIKVPDERLDNLSTLVDPKKITYAEIEFLDAAGFSGKGKETKGDLEITPELRMMDALVIVLDYFNPGARPEKDLQAIQDEMIISDMAQLETNIDKIARTIKLTGNQERTQELEVLKKCQEALNTDRLIAELALTEEEAKLIRGYTFLSQKPQLAVFNISEDRLADSDKIAEEFSSLVKPEVREIAVICGKIEMELAQLSETERFEFMKDLGIERPAVEKFIQQSYALLGLISFFTIGPPEARAWTIRKGWTAPKAAGAVHSDFERGFIRAEVASYDDYMVHKTLPALKAAAKLHVEGKDYVVQDGDVILFRFNI